MRSTFALALALASIVALPVSIARGDSAKVGKPAPDFTLTDTDGNSHSLASLQGKVVVVEWFNPDCPFVKYSHGQGPLKDMAARWAKKGVVWLAVNSGAPGKQGAGKDRNVKARKEYGMTYPVLLDENGAVGKSWGAKTTPHMYIVDAKGTLVYAGGLDNAPFGRVEGDKLVPYVDLALEQLLAGKKVETSETRSYGCSVKYAD